MVLQKVSLATSGTIFASDHNTIQDNVEDWVQDLDGQVAGSTVFTYNNDGNISGISTNFGDGEGYTFHYVNGSVIGSVVEDRENKTIVNGFTFNNGSVLDKVVRTVN